MVVAYIGLGGNLGDAAATVSAAICALNTLPGTRLLRASQLYVTPAWGVSDQPDFVNAVAAVETSLAPHALLDALLDLERSHGRTRASDGSDRWGPRTLDLDILLHGDAQVNEARLCIPHPRLHERAFALVPLVEIAADLVIPGVGPARSVLSVMDAGGVKALR